MAPRAKASEVFTNFHGEGWPNSGVAFLTAMTGPAAYLSIADSAVHLSEEVKDSARIVPRAMIVTAVTNYVLAFGIVGRSSTPLLRYPSRMVQKLTQSVQSLSCFP
jgi:amino acid transporter